MKSRTWFFIIATIVLVFIGYAYYPFLLLLKETPNSSLEKFGVFGDSFGVLTSLFSALTILGLIYTINLQREDLTISREELALTRKELKEQKEEMKLQNETLSVQQFENTLFNMINLFTKCRDDIYVNNTDNDKGLKAIQHICENDLNFRFLEYHGLTNKSLTTEDNINNFHKSIYKNYGVERYFRMLYNIINLIDNAGVCNKEIYSDILRGMLSKNETYILFYNCLSDYGKNEMKSLVIKYKLIKYIDKESIHEGHLYLLKDFEQV